MKRRYCESRSLEWLAELNDEQREAVCHGEGPLLVIAGAGTGKTRTLAYRVAYLIASGTDPSRILLLTFTRRAAEEMIRRATSIVARSSGGVKGHVWGGTFHAIANRLLRLYAKSASLSPEFTVMDEGDAQDLIDVIRHEMNLHERKKRFPKKGTCLAIYSRTVNGSETLSHVLGAYFPWCAEWETELKELFRRYVSRKQERNVLDYDDLLLYLAELLTEPEIAKRIERRFDHVLVDEYQDTNKLQAAILRGLRRENRNIMIVGDDAQSIYSFRAAAVENMFDFPKDFPGAKLVTLEQNYRSVCPILETTNRLISHAEHRYSKELYSSRRQGDRPKLVTCVDERSQDEYVVDRVLEHYEQGISLRRQAVLFRAASLSNSLEVELGKRNIPFHKYGGLRFLEAAHIKDLLAFLRIAENPRDEIAWFRILQMLDGIGPATASKMIDHIVAHQYDPKSISTYPVPPGASEEVRTVSGLFERLRSKPVKPSTEVELVIRAYGPFLQRIYENPEPRLRDLENLQQIASRYRSRRNFLVDLQLDPPTSTSDLAGPPAKDEDWLVLSTIHSAKGCEWDVVYLIHASDANLPSDMSTGSPEEIEEERRLAYVATTRARDFLYVTWPFRYYHSRSSFTDRHIYPQLSRFFTSDVRATMEEIAVAQDPLDDPLDPDPGPSHDIGGRIRSMWD